MVPTKSFIIFLHVADLLNVVTLYRHDYHFEGAVSRECTQMTRLRCNGCVTGGTEIRVRYHECCLAGHWRQASSGSGDGH